MSVVRVLARVVLDVALFAEVLAYVILHPRKTKRALISHLLADKPSEGSHEGSGT